MPSPTVAPGSPLGIASLLSLAAITFAGATTSAAAQTPVDAGRIYLLINSGPDRSRIDSFRPDGTDRRTIVRSEKGTTFDPPAVSPDGRTLLYTALTPKAKNPAQLLTVPTTGGTPTVAERGRYLYEGATFTRDGQSIIVSRLHPTKFTEDHFVAPTEFLKSELYALPATGGTARQLTDNHSDDYYPSYGSDGRIYFSRDAQDEFGGDEWSMAADGTDERRLEHSRLNTFQGSLSPDGTRLLLQQTDRRFTKGQNVETNLDGSAPRTIFPFTKLDRALSSATYSPDGQQIAALEATGDRQGYRSYTFQIGTIADPTKATFTLKPNKGEQFFGISWAVNP